MTEACDYNDYVSKIAFPTERTFFHRLEALEKEKEAHEIMIRGYKTRIESLEKQVEDFMNLFRIATG